MLLEHQLLDWLNQKSETRFVFGLERMHAALRFFHTKSRATFIQVLGTNGKGSSIECLKNILRAHQKSVACYTSPHLFHLYDRFMVNDVAIQKKDFILHLSAIYTAEHNQEIPCLSYFETTTILAYLYFCTQDLDYIIFEAGLGGRLDATSALSFSHIMLTSIDYDHQEYLGETLTEIANEKCSVIQAHHHVFSLHQSKQAHDVLLHYSNTNQAQLYLENQHFSLLHNTQSLDYKVFEHTLHNVHLGLKGEHQHHNALLATALANQLLHKHFQLEKVKLALKKTFKLGRYQHMIVANMRFTFDVAHNQQSFAALMKTSADDPIDAYLLSMLQDKPWKEILTRLMQLDKPIYVCLGLSERSWKEAELLHFIQQQHPSNNIVFFKDYQTALNHIQTHHQHCLVFGSFFFVGPCIEYLNSTHAADSASLI